MHTRPGTENEKKKREGVTTNGDGSGVPFLFFVFSLLFLSTVVFWVQVCGVAWRRQKRLGTRVAVGVLGARVGGKQEKGRGRRVESIRGHPDSRPVFVRASTKVWIDQPRFSTHLASIIARDSDWPKMGSRRVGMETPLFDRTYDGMLARGAVGACSGLRAPLCTASQTR